MEKEHIMEKDGLEKPIIVEFPLRGEWAAPNTPGKSIPSHGTDQLGQRYAYDFYQVDWEKKGMPFYDAHGLRYFFFGLPLQLCLCWGQAVYAPCNGEIVKAEDGLEERPVVHWLSDLWVVLKNALTFNPEKDGLQTVVGNYVIMKCRDNVFALFAHLQTGSIQVSAGQSIEKGQVLGRVGHSGNSTAPHLHFQLMDSSDLIMAKGIPCAFRVYERWREGDWETTSNGVPTDKDRMRFNG